MVHLRLTDEQAEVLRRVLVLAVAELRTEIIHTDDLEFRLGLKQDRERALEVLDLLEPVTV